MNAQRLNNLDACIIEHQLNPIGHHGHNMFGIDQFVGGFGVGRVAGNLELLFPIVEFKQTL